MRVKFYAKHTEKQQQQPIYEIVIRKVIMVMVRVKQLYLMLDGYRDSSQDTELCFSKGFLSA